MSTQFDRKKVVDEFEEYLEHHHSYFNFMVCEAGLEIDNLAYFIGDQLSWERATDYYQLELIRDWYKGSKKFKEQFIHQALELVFKEFEIYTRLDIDWLKEAIFSKLKNGKYKRTADNRIYGALVHYLALYGSSKKNSFEFVSAVSGIAETVVRDSYYETDKLIKKFRG